MDKLGGEVDQHHISSVISRSWFKTETKCYHTGKCSAHHRSSATDEESTALFTGDCIEREYISSFHKWTKKQRVNWSHCQRTHYYPAQPVEIQRSPDSGMFPLRLTSPRLQWGRKDVHFPVCVWSCVSMTLLIAQSDLSQPFIRPWMVCLNVVPEVFKYSKKTPTIFQLAWSRAPSIRSVHPA